MPRCPTCQAEHPPQTVVCPNDGTPLPEGLEGQVLGERYRITRELGEGGMGRVYLAEHVILGKQVAVKVLRAEYSRQPDLVKRFQLEAVAASQIGQENIVDVSDFGRTPDNSFYFVMEYVQGQSLAQLVERGPVKVHEALPLLLQITKALGAAHSRGIIHRDLKPDNVLVTQTSDGTPHAKVLDFGISKVGEAQTGPRITQVGMVVGTPHYMAPEQATGEPIDLRADIYAFGVLAYETLTAQVPFDAPNSVQILMKHQREAPTPPSQRNANVDLPERLEALVMRCLAKNRVDRPQDMGEVGRELAACMAEQGMVSGPTPLVMTAIPAQARASNPSMPEARVREVSVPKATLAPLTAPPTSEAQPPRDPTEPELTADEVRALGQHRPKRALAIVAAVVVVGGLAAVVNLARHPKTEVQTVAIAPTPTPPSPVSTPEPKPAVAAPTPPPVVAAQPEPTPTPSPAVAEKPEPAKPAPTPTPKPAAKPEKPAVAAHPRPSAERVALVSVPAGARVFGASGPLGSTPIELEVPRGETREVKLVADGYREVSRRLRSGERRVEIRLTKLAVPADHALPPPHLKPADPSSAPPRHLKPAGN